MFENVDFGTLEQGLQCLIVGSFIMVLMDTVSTIIMLKLGGKDINPIIKAYPKSLYLIALVRLSIASFGMYIGGAIGLVLMAWIFGGSLESGGINCHLIRKLWRKRRCKRRS